MLGACGSPEVPPPPIGPAGAGMPRFERRMLVIAEEDRPEERFMFFDVDAQGSVIYAASRVEAPLYRRVDSTGRPILAFGQTGEGPGETRMPVGLWYAGDTMRIHESGRGMLVELDREGRSLRDRRLPPGGITLSWVGSDSVDWWESLPLPSEVIEARTVFRIPLGAPSERRRLVGPEDAVLDSASTARGSNAVLSMPYVAATDHFWIADGWNFTLRHFRADGSVLATIEHQVAPNTRGPRQLRLARELIERMPRFMRGPNGERIPLEDQRGRLDTLDRERIDHFTRNPLHLDVHGRLWVIGLSHDSTSVDIFADTTWLGRTMLPCFASRVGTRAALGPGWLLLECEIDDSDWPTELQLYRVIEGN